MNYIRIKLISLCMFFLFSCSGQVKSFSISSKPIKVKKNKDFDLLIPSNLGQGYQWKLFDTTFFKTIIHSFKTNPDSSKSTDIEIFKLKGKKRGKYKMAFYYVRPFDPISDSIKSKKIIQPITVR